MKKISLILAFLLFGTTVHAQTLGIDRTWAPFVYTFRFDSLGTSNDSSLTPLYIPTNHYVLGMYVTAATSDTSDFRLVAYSGTANEEVTAYDSVRTRNTSRVPYYNAMTVTLTPGMYRINHIYRHTGGASSSKLYDVIVILWGTLNRGS